MVYCNVTQFIDLARQPRDRSLDSHVTPQVVDYITSVRSLCQK